jgi:glycosyltransferase involved in cell wall biosynthesis
VSQPAISVIVAVSNRPKLVAALRSSYQQNENECAEIVVVQSGDDPDWMETSLDRLDLPIVHVRTNQPFNKSYQLNIGVAAARCELLMLQDADVTLPSGFLEAARSFVAPSVVCCLAAVIESQDPSRRRIAPGNILCRRDQFMHVKGMNSFLYGWGWEDVDLLIRFHLAGFDISATGVGIHATHSDDSRSLINSEERRTSHERNRRASLERISRRGIRGTYESDVQYWRTVSYRK